MDINFNLKDRVVFHSTGSDVLDGRTGYILGQSTNDLSTHYMVMLDTPLETHLAINITKYCLKLISE